MKAALVTGASGFVGSHLCSALQAQGYEVAGTYGNEHEHRGGAVRWFPWTLGESFDDVLQATKPTAVLHLASPSHVPTANENPEATIDAIFKASTRLAATIAKASFVERVLYVSSAEVYGLPHDELDVFSESHATEPCSIYGICKLGAELWFRRTLRDRVIVVRPFNQIGPGQSPRFAVGSFAAQIAGMKNEPKKTLRTGDLEVIRDWVDVRESALGHVAALERGRPGEVYNLCSGRGLSLRSLVDAMLREAGGGVAIEVDPSRVRLDAPRVIVGDAGKLTRDTGWKAERDPTLAAIDAVREKMVKS